jgi:hypothetical protein
MTLGASPPPRPAADREDAAAIVEGPAADVELFQPPA